MFLPAGISEKPWLTSIYRAARKHVHINKCIHSRIKTTYFKENKK